MNKDRDNRLSSIENQVRETWDTLKEIKIQKEKEIKAQEETKDITKEIKTDKIESITKIKKKPKPKDPFWQAKTNVIPKVAPKIGFDSFKVKIPKKNFENKLEVQAQEGKVVIFNSYRLNKGGWTSINK